MAFFSGGGGEGVEILVCRIVLFKRCARWICSRGVSRKFHLAGLSEVKVLCVELNGSLKVLQSLSQGFCGDSWHTAPAHRTKDSNAKLLCHKDTARNTMHENRETFVGVLCRADNFCIVSSALSVVLWGVSGREVLPPSHITHTHAT